MKVNHLFGVFLMFSACGESPDSFAVRGTDEDKNTENEISSDSESESTEILGSDSVSDKKEPTDTDTDKETDMDTASSDDMDTDTDMVTDADTDMDTDTDMDVETDGPMETSADTDTDTDADVDADTDTDTDTGDIHDPICEPGRNMQDDFVCQSDNLDSTISNGCPFDMNTQYFEHCCTEALWVCPLSDNVEYFGYNNYQTEWTICEDQNGTAVCPEFYVCVQVSGFGRKCI